MCKTNALCVTQTFYHRTDYYLSCSAWLPLVEKKHQHHKSFHELYALYHIQNKLKLQSATNSTDPLFRNDLEMLIECGFPYYALSPPPHSVLYNHRVQHCKRGWGGVGR